MTTNMIRSGYNHGLFDPKNFKLMIDEAMEALSSVKYDAIAVRGHSGTIFGGALKVEFV